MDLDQIEREIFAAVPHMKLFVSRFPGVAVDVFFESGRDIGAAHLHGLGAALLRCGCPLWQLLQWLLLREAWMFAGSK